MILRPAILFAVGATLLLMVVRRMRQQKLKERHALVFIFTSIPFLILAIWPDAIELLSDVLGISMSTVMLLGVSVFLILLIFELLTIVSVMDRKISTLAQMVGILNEKMRLIERRQQDDAFGPSAESHSRDPEITTQVPPTWSSLKENIVIAEDKRNKEVAASTVKAAAQ